MDYRYITPEIMMRGTFTVLNPEMFEESERYNYEISASRIKKRHLLEMILGFCASNLIFMGIAVFIASSVLKAATQMHLFVILCLACFLYLLFIVRQIIKKDFNIPANIIFSLFYLIAHPGCVFMIAFNAVLSYIIKKKWAELKQRNGYPYFVTLVVDSKERIEKEDGTAASHVAMAYERQKRDQTAELEEISVSSEELLDISLDENKDSFESVEL